MKTFLKKNYWQILEQLEKLKFRLYLKWLTLSNGLSGKSLIDANGPVISLTSYGTRVKTVYLTIESIAHGRTLPCRIILWLDDPAIYANPPASLRRLRKRGLEILTGDNFGPHKKYFPYVDSEASFFTPLVTADDDVIYPKEWLSTLVSSYRANKSVINCHRARQIQLKDGLMQPYLTWPYCINTHASFGHMALGVSGVIYPPEFLAQLKSAGRGFFDCCPKADDLWLHVNAIRHGWKIRQIADQPLETPEVPGTQEIALFKTNQFSGENDAQIAKTYTESDMMILNATPP